MAKVAKWKQHNRLNQTGPPATDAEIAADQDRVPHVIGRMSTNQGQRKIDMVHASSGGPMAGTSSHANKHRNVLDDYAQKSHFRGKGKR